MKDPGALIHSGIGLAVTAGTGFGLIAWTWLPWWACAGWVPISAVIFYTREWWQHRDDDPIWTLHRHIEAAAGPLGSAVGVGVVYGLGVWLASALG